MSQRTLQLLLVAVSLAWTSLMPGGALGADSQRGGVGITITATKDGNIFVQAVLPGGPADRAGVKTGDVVLSVDGKSAAGMSPAEAAALIVGPAGTAVTLRVRHVMGVEATLTIKRAPINAPAPTESDAQPPVAVTPRPSTENTATGETGQSLAPRVLKMHKAGIRDQIARRRRPTSQYVSAISTARKSSRCFPASCLTGRRSSRRRFRPGNSILVAKSCVPWMGRSPR